MAASTPEVLEVPDLTLKSLEELWEDWKVEFKKTYADEDEEKRRFEIFKTKKEMIQEHNEKYKRGETTFTMGLNQFSDREQHEICCGLGSRKGLDPPPPPPKTKNLGRSKSTV